MRLFGVGGALVVEGAIFATVSPSSATASASLRARASGLSLCQCPSLGALAKQERRLDIGIHVVDARLGDEGGAAEVEVGVRPCEVTLTYPRAILGAQACELSVTAAPPVASLGARGAPATAGVAKGRKRKGKVHGVHAG